MATVRRRRAPIAGQGLKALGVFMQTVVIADIAGKLFDWLRAKPGRRVIIDHDGEQLCFTYFEGSELVEGPPL